MQQNIGQGGLRWKRREIRLRARLRDARADRPHVLRVGIIRLGSLIVVMKHERYLNVVTVRCDVELRFEPLRTTLVSMAMSSTVVIASYRIEAGRDQRFPLARSAPYLGELARTGGHAGACIAGVGRWERVEMVRRYVHLSSEHLTGYVNRASDRQTVGNGNVATIQLRS